MINNSINITNKDMEKYDIIQKLINKNITGKEASKLVWVSTRQIRRMKKKVLENWIEWLIHKAKNKPSNRKISEDLKVKTISFIKEKYHDFKPTFASEKLKENHWITISKESLRALMIENKLWKVKKRKQSKNIHVWRARKDNYWEMQQFDWSYHKWLEDRNWEVLFLWIRWESKGKVLKRWPGKELCLLLAVDDATWEITKAKFDTNEWTIAVCKFWKEYNEEVWIPVSIYLDKFSTYKINHPSAIDNKNLMTQFQRASNQIWTKLITANSPEAKWRVERMNRTLQDRLVKDLRLAKINTTESANIFLKNWIIKFNEKFWVVPVNQSNLHKPLKKEDITNLDQIYSIHEERKINNDLTISHKGIIYLLDKDSTTYKNNKIGIYKKEIVTVETYLNWSIKIFYKQHYLSFRKIEKRPKKQWYVPVEKDKRLIENRTSEVKKSKSSWRNLTYWKKLVDKKYNKSRVEQIEELRENWQLNLNKNNIKILEN